VAIKVITGAVRRGQQRRTERGSTQAGGKG